MNSTFPDKPMRKSSPPKTKNWKLPRYAGTLATQHLNMGEASPALRPHLCEFFLKYPGGKRKSACPDGRGSHTSDRGSGERASVHHLLRALHRGESLRLGCFVSLVFYFFKNI